MFPSSGEDKCLFLILVENWASLMCDYPPHLPHSSQGESQLRGATLMWELEEHDF